jgi:hypothetical protein
LLLPLQVSPFGAQSPVGPAAQHCPFATHIPPQQMPPEQLPPSLTGV